jgi:hypothetical protein
MAIGEDDGFPHSGAFVMRKAIVRQEFAPAQGVLSFYTYEVLTTILHNLVAAYPQLAEMTSIGKSLEGRGLLSLRLHLSWLSLWAVRRDRTEAACG